MRIERSKQAKMVYNKILMIYPFVMWLIGVIMFTESSANTFVKLVFALIAILVYFRLAKKSSKFLKIKKEDEMKSIYNFPKKLKRIKKFFKIVAYALIIIGLFAFIGAGELFIVLGFPICSFLLATCIEIINLYIGKEYLRVGIWYMPINDIVKAEKIVNGNSILYTLFFKGERGGYINVKKKYLTKEAESLLDERLSAVEKKRNTGFW